MRVLPTLRQLKFLVALADRRHFGRAAEACLVSQSTLSAAIQELEEALGVTLFERTRRSVAPTAIGLEIAERARSILKDAEDLVDLRSGGAGPAVGAVSARRHSDRRAVPSAARPPASARGRATPEESISAKSRRRRCSIDSKPGEIDAAILALPVRARQRRDRGPLARPLLRRLLAATIVWRRCRRSARKTWRTRICCCSRTAIACASMRSPPASSRARGATSPSRARACRRW